MAVDDVVFGYVSMRAETAAPSRVAATAFVGVAGSACTAKTTA